MPTLAGEHPSVDLGVRVGSLREASEQWPGSYTDDGSARTQTDSDTAIYLTSSPGAPEEQQQISEHTRGSVLHCSSALLIFFYYLSSFWLTILAVFVVEKPYSYLPGIKCFSACGVSPYVHQASYLSM